MPRGSFFVGSAPPGVGQGQETFDVDGFGAGFRPDTGRLAQPLAAENLEAGAQHLTTLAEGGGGDGL